MEIPQNLYPQQFTKICVTQNEFIAATSTTNNFSSLGVLQNFSQTSDFEISTSTTSCYEPQGVYISLGIEVFIAMAVIITAVLILKK